VRDAISTRTSKKLSDANIPGHFLDVVGCDELQASKGCSIIWAFSVSPKSLKNVS
jgi:hypothetical protein